MTTTVISTNTIGAGAQFTYAANNDSLVILPNVTLGSTSGAVIGTGGFTGLSVTVLGTLLSTSSLILSASSFFTIAQSGNFISLEPSAGNSGIFFNGGGSSLTNNGDIAVDRAIGVLANGGSNTITNTGTIAAASPVFLGLFASSNDQFVNSGTVTASNRDDANQDQRDNNGVQTEGSNTIITNLASGIIHATGTEGAGVNLSGAANGSIVTNMGEIVSQKWFGVDFGDMIAGNTARLVNTGVISGEDGSFRGAVTADVVINQGTMNGSVLLGGGADLFDSRGGSVIGAVSGEAGNDTIYGGLGADSLDGGANDDTIYFSIEEASVIGGAGTADRAINTYNDFGLTFDVGGNGFEFYTGSAAGETIITTTATAIDVSAGGGSDLVQGNIGNDTLRGDDGNDSLEGNAGLDSLISGNGNDRLLGGDANDNLTGGAGFDNFAFNGALGGNDTITDFTIGVDKIEILRSGFLSPAVWSAGALDPARFQASANPSPINGVATFLLDNAGPGAGQLYWNDGNGGAIGIALIGLAPGQNLNFFTAADFVLV
jgi:serralysin